MPAPAVDFSLRLHTPFSAKAKGCLCATPRPKETKEMIKNTLFTQPYDITAQGFYFETIGEFRERSARAVNDYGEPSGLLPALRSR